MKRLDTRRLGSPRLCVQSVEPIFGETYKAGYVGFTFRGSPLLSEGIAHFTRWSRLSDIWVDRAFIVTGEDEAVEVAAHRTVQKTDLSGVFEDVKTQVFFRKPKKCGGSLASNIAATAIAQVGTRFDDLLLAARILEGSFLARWLRTSLDGSGTRFAGHLSGASAAWASAEFVAYCLDCQPELAGRGVLGLSGAGLSPQVLFECEEVFAGWRTDRVEGPARP